ncbi:MAG: N-6 DNA methylase [Anaerolineae bacterium]|nr:N-6 DNA methylase [Anaerolineae bacterium]
MSDTSTSIAPDVLPTQTKRKKARAKGRDSPLQQVQKRVSRSESIADEFMRMLTQLAERGHYWRSEVFRDFVGVCGVLVERLENDTWWRAMWRAHAGTKLEDETETRFAAIDRRYSPDEMTEMAKLFGCLVPMARGLDGQSYNYADHLGVAYMQFGSKSGQETRGQFFTPFSVSKLMAMMLMDEESLNADILTRLNEAADHLGVYIDPRMSPEEVWRVHQNQLHSYVRPVLVLDPCCGAGSMLIAAASVAPRWAIDAALIQMVAIDIDPLCAAMTRIQMWLFGITANVFCADSLTAEILSILPEPVQAVYRPIVEAVTPEAKVEATAQAEEAQEALQMSLFSANLDDDLKLPMTTKARRTKKEQTVPVHTGEQMALEVT